MDNLNPNPQSQNLQSQTQQQDLQQKKKSYKWRFLYTVSIPLGFILSLTSVYKYLEPKGFSDEAGIVFQFWILISIILTPLFSLIIFTILNIIKNRRISKNLIIFYAIIIFFSILAFAVVLLQANYNGNISRMDEWGRTIILP